MWIHNVNEIEHLQSRSEHVLEKSYHMKHMMSFFYMLTEMKEQK